MNQDEIDKAVAEMDAAKAAAKEAKAKEVIKLTIDMGYIDQSFLGICEHKRGRNWIATVGWHPGSPGGMSRHFWKSGSGFYRRVPAELNIGDYLEAAHEYVSGGGRNDKQRSYYRVLDLGESYLIVCGSGKPVKLPPSIDQLRHEAGL